MINSKFQKEFDRLNARQREAVETIEGPVMVIAGPGTGKTQVIAMRIANILKETQIDAGNILALTFTNSGVWAMKKRLLEIIGPASYKIHVHTFHSFCNEVIQTFPDKFIFNKQLDQVTDLDRILFIRQILDQNNFEKIKTLKAPYFYQNTILKNINDLKQENVSPHNFLKIVQKELESWEKIPDLYHEKGISKGKIKAKYLSEKENLEKNLDLADAYEQYQNLLKKNGQYDYADMILLVVQKLKNDAELLSYYQEKFQYILVDEYQDTNSGQNEVVRLLASFYDQPNLFVVGDDEQSIFRFQGAALENILYFVKSWPETKIIVLENNYRSSQKILDAARAVIENNQYQIFNELNLKKKLLSHRDFVDTKIFLANFSQGAIEDYYIGQTIKKLIKKGVNPSEIACIYKEHRDSDHLVEIFAKLQIPFVQARAENILLDKTTQKILSLLEIIADPNLDHKMFEVLHFDFLRLETLDIYKLTHAASRSKKPISEFIFEPTELKLKNKKAVSKFSKLLLSAIKNFQNESFARAFELLINESGYLDYLLKLDDAPVKLNRLRTLFDEIKKLNVKRKNLNLPDFLEFVAQLNENNLGINETMFDTDFQGVKLLTAHQAKGLEFEHVFIFHLTDNHWGNKNARTLLRLPDGILKMQTSSADQAEEEERRLFYVALTRAKKMVYLSYADSYSDSDKIQIQSKFVLELPTKLIFKTRSKTFEKNHLPRLKNELKKTVWHHEKDLKEFLNKLAEKFVLSATSLNAYLDCPKKFFYNQLLRVPKVKDFNLAYGSAVHFALEMFFKKQMKDLTLPTLDNFINFYNEGLKKEILSAEDEKRAVHQGEKILRNYYNFYAETWQKSTPIAAEYTFGFHNVHFGNIPITGKIDKIELLDKIGKKVKIIDYKTSQPKSQNYLLGQTKDPDLSYLYQAFFYKLLAENDPLFDWTIGEVEFDFVADSNGNFTKVNVPIDQDQYHEFLTILQKSYKNILALNFESNLSSCDQGRFICEYVKTCKNS